MLPNPENRLDKSFPYRWVTMGELSGNDNPTAFSARKYPTFLRLRAGCSSPLLWQEPQHTRRLWFYRRRFISQIWPRTSLVQCDRYPTTCRLISNPMPGLRPCSWWPYRCRSFRRGYCLQQCMWRWRNLAIPIALGRYRRGARSRRSHRWLLALCGVNWDRAACHAPSGEGRRFYPVWWWTHRLGLVINSTGIAAELSVSTILINDKKNILIIRYWGIIKGLKKRLYHLV